METVSSTSATLSNFTFLVYFMTNVTYPFFGGAGELFLLFSFPFVFYRSPLTLQLRNIFITFLMV